MRQTAYAKRQKFINFKGFWQLVARHKVLTVALIFVALTVIAFTLIWYSDYSQKLSKDDFDQITNLAKSVLDKTSHTKVYIHRACEYRHGEFITIPSLECEVSMVAYLPYVNALNAVNVGHKFRDNIARSFDKQTYDLSSFYTSPQNGFGEIFATAPGTHEKYNCIFYISANRNAKNAVSFLPERTSDDLIALSFECGGPSRGAYFPLTS